MSTKRRILGGAFANATALVISAALQIVTVPVLTSAWGVDRYGLWVVLTTIPAYFALSDFGFSSAATSEMAMQIARGNRELAQKTFQSIWLLLNATSLAIIAAIVIAVVAIAHRATAPAWMSEQGLTIAVLALYSGVIMNVRTLMAAMRALQSYALGTFIYSAFILLETALILSLAHAGADFLVCALAMLCAQLVNCFVMWGALRYEARWLQIGTSKAALNEVKRLWIPALAAMAIPSALALNLQGLVVVAGLMISPAAAATLVSVRTVTRLAMQAVGTINRATMTELSAANARGEQDKLEKIVALNLASVGFILAPAALLIGIWGNDVVSLWTHGKIQPSFLFVSLMAIGMLLHALWYYTSNLLLASNSHTNVARPLIVIPLFSLALAIPIASAWGLIGLAALSAATELACLVQVLRCAWKMSVINLTSFKAALGVLGWAQYRTRRPITKSRP